MEEKIEKTGENQVVAIKFLYDKAGKEVEISREEFGINKVEQELEQQNFKKKYWKDVDKGKEETKVQAKIDRLNNIKNKF